MHHSTRDLVDRLHVHLTHTFVYKLSLLYLNKQAVKYVKLLTKEKNI